MAHFLVCYNGKESFFDTMAECEAFCETLMNNRIGSDVWASDADGNDVRLCRTYMYNMLTGEFEVSDNWA